MSTVDSTAVEARVDVPGDEFRAMDRLDESMILDELQGRPSTVMVYSFGTGRERKTGLSYAGVAECVRTMNTAGFTAIRVSPDVQPQTIEVLEPNERDELVTFIRVTVYAEDSKNGGGQWGVAQQAKFQTYKDKSRKPTLDPFASAKALSKAQRNAMLPLVPVMYRETLIAQSLGDESRVRVIRAGAGAEREALMPPALVTPEALECKEKIRAVYGEIKDLNRLALLPGQFHVKLRAVEHELKGLEEFLGFLEGLRDHEKAK